MTLQAPDQMQERFTPEAFHLGPLPATFEEAVRFMRNKVFLATPRYEAQQWRADRSGAHPDILAFERAFVRRFHKLGVPMFAHCVNRSNATQARLFQTGKTKAKAGQSPHNHGMAVDLVHGLRGWELPQPCWDLIGHLGYEVAQQLGVKVEWGGDWSFYDPAHWELADWREYPTEAQVAPTRLEDLLTFYANAEPA